MRKYTRVILLVMMVFLCMGQATYGANEDITQKDIDEGVAFCRDYPVSLQVDGDLVESDVPPVIIKERTLIPARAVFESMGADVSWDEDTRLVEVRMGTSNVKLTIDSDTAYVNGEAVDMDVPAMIIDDRTLIPVRFVAESLSCGVDWDDLSRKVILTSPDENANEKMTIDSIEITDKSDFYRITIQGDNMAEGYKSFAYDSPERFGIDIDNAELDMKDGKIKADRDNEIFDTVRYSQFDADTVRVVVDLNEKIAGKVSLSTDKNRIFIDFDKESTEDGSNASDYGLDPVDWRASEKLVVIDPGHGGKDTGSQAINNGALILNEKEINLDVAMRLNEMLQAAGVKTYILRETDTTITLYDRPALANAANADLYVSIHNNSSDNASARGVEVYYDSKTSESNYGIYSKHLAEVVYQDLLDTIGTIGRGAKSEPAYAVLNKTNMPAIIIEGSFLSNAEDLELMLTDEFRENYALAAAKAIIQILNESADAE
jgi:N-acetylmuramoyl-L-alanine amidase